MKQTALVLLTFAAMSFAADPKSSPVKDPSNTGRPQEVKRLGSVTWDLATHKLGWVVQKGTMVNGEFVPASEQKFEISPDDAVMATAEEQRGFDGDEAVSLHHLLDVLSLYCAESVVWWDQGEGSPVPAEAKPGHRAPTKTEKPATSDPKPVKVGQPEPAKKPKYKVPDSDIVALVK